MPFYAPLGFIALLGVLAVSVVPALGGEVFRCPDGKGGFVLRDVPCSIAAPDEQGSAPPPPASEPPRVRENVLPRPKPRTAPPAVVTPQLSLSYCLFTDKPRYRIQNANPLAVELAWEVEVKKRCAQPVSARVIFRIYYRYRRQVLAEDSTTVAVPAGTDSKVVQGIMRISQETRRRMFSYDVTLSEVR